jgi:hypothetical protein
MTIHRVKFETSYLRGEASWFSPNGGGRIWMARVDSQNVAEAQANGDNTATPLFESVGDARAFLASLGGGKPTQLDAKVIDEANLGVGNLSEDFDLVRPNDGVMVGSYGVRQSRLGAAIGSGPDLRVDNLAAVNVREHRLVAKFDDHQTGSLRPAPKNRVALCQ